MKPKERMELRLAGLVGTYPYFASVLMGMGAKPTPKIPSAGVDARGRLYFNPRILDAWSREELNSVLLHELWHILSRHRIRGISFFGGQKGLTDNHKLWNIACDMEIHANEMEDRYTFPLPEDYICARKRGWPIGQTAEWYAEKLLEEAAKGDEPGEDGGDEGGGNGEGEGEGEGEGKKGEEGNTKNPGDSSGNSDGDSSEQSQPSTPGGSSVDGTQRVWEEDASEEEGLSPDEREELHRQKVIEDMKAQDPGSLPGNFRQWLDDSLLSPEVSWQQRLEDLVKAAVSYASGYLHESFHQYNPISASLAVGFGRAPAMPVMVSPEIRASIVVDTSGSMGEKLLQEALSEVDGILRACTTQSATVLSVDAAVHECKQVFNASQVVLSGGGGTNMRVGIKAALEQYPKPEVIIVLTDGETPWPKEKEGRYELVVGLLGQTRRHSSYWRDSIPSWAHTVEIS